MSKQISSGCRRLWTAFKRGQVRLLNVGLASLGRDGRAWTLMGGWKRGPGARSGAEDLGQAFALLDQEQLRLQGVSAEVEAQFLGLSSMLESLPKESERLVKDSERLLTLASGKEDGATAFQTTFELLKAPLDFIDHHHRRSLHLVARLEEALVQIDRMLGYELALRRTVAPLKFIRTLFKVESAGLSHSVRQMFLALTEDIDRLQQQVGQTFEARFEGLRSTRKTISAVNTRLKASAATQSAAAQDRKEAIERALSDLQADLKRNEERDIRLTAVSRAIDQQAGRMVVSLQTQDIVSQKLAHVLQALVTLRERFEESDATDNSSSAGVALAYCRDASQVQSAQLQAVARDLMVASDEISGAASRIAGQITTLDKECLSLKEFDKVTAGADGLVQVLLDTIADVQAIVTRAVQSAEESYLAIRPIGELTSNVTGIMRDLSAQMRLIALNAQVQAAHIGSGTGLEVLAAATAAVSMETTDISENVARELDTLTGQLAEHVRAFEELHQIGTSQQQRLETGGTEQEAELHAFRDETLATLARIGETVEAIGSMADSMGRKLDFRSLIDNRINLASAALDRISQASRRCIETRGFKASDPAQGGDFTRSYTMASERDVHDAVIHGRRPTASEIGISTGCAAASPELFGDGADYVAGSIVSPATGTMPAPAPSGGTSARCVVAVPGKNAPDPPVDPARSLGDNVDLF